MPQAGPTRYYYPRAYFELAVPGSQIPEARNEIGDVRFPVPVRTARLEINDHNHADQLTVSLSSMDCAFDLRLTKDALGNFWFGDAGGNQALRPTEDNHRFVGILKRARRVSETDGASEVELTFLDYTSVFLDCKNFPASGMPDLSMTLLEAWHIICDFTGPRIPGTKEVQSSVKGLRDHIKLEGGLKEFPVIGLACASRFLKQGKVIPPAGADAWAVWNHCCGMCGLITYFRRDDVIVTTDRGYYSHGNHPRLIWGKNLESLTEEYDTALTQSGIIITSFDPLTNSSLEAYWPPIGDQAVKRSRAVAKPRKKKPFTQDEIRQAEQREHYAYPGVTDPDRLEQIARMVYAERSRQQLEGTAKTSEFRVGSRRSIGADDGSVDVHGNRAGLLTREAPTAGVDGTTFDMLTLIPGDDVRIEVDEDTRTEILQFATVDERLFHLLSKGYQPGAAEVLARNVEWLRSFSPVFHVKSVNLSMELDEEGGNFDIEVGYHNRYMLPDQEPPDDKGP